MKKEITMNLGRIRELAKMSKNIDELIEFIMMEVELLKQMKDDGVILLSPFEELGWVSYYICTINPEVSEKYDFVEDTSDDVTDEYIEDVIEVIHELLDDKFNENDTFYTLRFTMDSYYVIHDMEELIAFIQDKITVLTKMKNDGMKLPDNIYIDCDDYDRYTLEYDTAHPEKYAFEKGSISSRNEISHYPSIKLNEIFI